jgi:hypothetical protein
LIIFGFLLGSLVKNHPLNVALEETYNIIVAKYNTGRRMPLSFPNFGLWCVL